MTDEFKDMEDSEIDKLTKEEQESFTDLVARQRQTIEELLDAKISEDDTQDEVKVKARAFALQHLPSALQTIADLAAGADKDSTRLSAARTIWAIASATAPSDSSDPIENLFKRLDVG